MYHWIIFLHVLSVFGFLIGHGATAVVTIRLRGEQDVTKAKAWAELYNTRLVLGFTYLSLIILLITGVVGGFSGKWWGNWWIWISLALFLGISLAMGFIGRGYFERLRKLMGIEPKGEQAPPEEIQAHLAQAPATSLSVIGLGGIAVILWLMMFKPF